MFSKNLRSFQISASKKPAQSQASLTDQLDVLERLAAQNGLYDAQDWLRQVRANQEKK